MVDDDLARLREQVDRVGRTSDRRLPPETRLCAELGISRSRLRTLLKRLEAEGLIWRHVGKGTFAGTRQIATDDASWSQSVSVDDVFNARIVLEPQLAAEAALRAKATDVAAMEQCLAAMAATESFVHWKQLDAKLHRAIAAAAHNPLLTMLHETLRSQMTLGIDARMADIFGAVAEPRRAADVEHAAIVEAVKAHDPILAEQRMRTHIGSVRQAMFGKR